MKHNSNKAFTLVELIVVITILAVLATIGFVSFTWYALESRDTKRKTDLATISKWLQVYLAWESQVPDPSETISTISFSWTTLLKQWYAGDSVLKTISVQEALDPLDKVFYTYSTNASNTKFQLVWFLEKNPVGSEFIQKKTFADYSNRYIYTIWSGVGVLLNALNQPIHEWWNTSIELYNDTIEYTAVFGRKNIVSESWNALKVKILSAQKNIFVWNHFDPNCPVDDIVIGDQVWAWCNSTLWNWFEWWKQSNGNDWIIWSCYDYNWVNNVSDGTCSIWNWLMTSNSNPKDFFDTKQPNAESLWYDSEFETVWWKLYTWEDAVNTACPSWWRVPTDEDWTTLSTYLNSGTECEWWIWWQCDGLWWKEHNTQNDTNNLVNALKIPLAGYRHSDGTTFYDRGSYINLWTSTPSNTTAYYRHMYWYFTWIYRNTSDQSHGYSVRCIRNNENY